MVADTLLGALTRREDVTGLTGVSNNAGAGDSGLGRYFIVHPSDTYVMYQVN
jgi:3-oxoacid CoA-transferase